MSATALLAHPDIIGLVVGINAADVKRRRLALHWSKRDLAERAGVTDRTVFNAENGHVGEAAAAAIIGALDVGEAEQARADEPELEVRTFIISTPGDGELKIVATGQADAVGRLDFNALVRPLREGRDPK